MLDFNEVFWHADKRGKIRRKLRILKFFSRTRRVADADFKTRTHCIADADYLPTSTLDVPVVLWSTYKNPSVTEKRSNRLGVRLGNKSHFWLINCLRGHHLQYGFPIASIGH